MALLAYSTGEPNIASSPEQDLWVAVVKQAIFDYAYARKASDKNERRRSIQHQRNARAWIFFSDEFTKVCALAGLDASRVQHIARVAAGEVV